jgi:regulator of protease activity HflC (stomatin/prohibitin superfamily)
MVNNYNEDSNNMPTSVKYAIAAVVLLFIGVIAWFSVTYTIQTGERGVMLTWGQANPQVLNEGLGFKAPFVQSVAIMDIQTQKYEADAAAASKDLQVVTCKIATNYRLVPERVPEIYSTLGFGYQDTIIKPLEQEAVKATTAKYTAEELITKREEVRLEMKHILTDRLAQRGIVVEEVSIINFDFSKSFNDAIEAKVTAQQQKQKAENDLARIEVEARQKIAIAEGNRNSTIAEAEGNSQAIILKAQADAQAVALINQELEKSPAYTEYIKASRWNGQLPTYVGIGAVPFMDIAAAK